MSIASSIVGIMNGVFGLSLNSLNRPFFGNSITIPSGTTNNCSVNFSNGGINTGFYCPTPGAFALVASGTGIFYCVSSTVLRLHGNTGFGWPAGDPLAGANDAGLKRIIGSVVGVTKGETAGGGWLQNTGGRGFSAADSNNATEVMANIDGTNLNFNVIAGRKYTGIFTFFASNTVGAEGLQFDFNGGTATMTNFRAGFEGTPVDGTLGENNSTALGTALTATTVSTSDVCYSIAVSFTVNKGGTFIPRFSEVSHTTGTATIRLGAAMWLEDMP